MQINNLTKCCKPRHFGSTASDSVSNGKRVRYKHYEEMDNDILRVRCLRKACSIVQSGGKLKLRDSLPAITATIIGTSLALAQPGKLASKAAKGLGFLATVAALDLGFEKLASFDSKVEQNFKKSGRYDKKTIDMGGFILGLSAGFGMLTGVLALPKIGNKLLNGNSKVSRFLSSEKDKLVSELNSSKFGQFVQNSVNPFLDKHKKVSKFLKVGLPLSAIFGEAFATTALNNSLSHDISKIATASFAKAKLIQKEARDHFDKIDAIEVK